MMTGFLFTALGWLVPLACLGVTVSMLVRMARAGRGHRLAYLLAPLVYGCAAVIALTVLGVLAPWTGALLSVMLTAVAAGWLADAWRLTLRANGGDRGKAAHRTLTGSLRNLRDATVGAWRDVQALAGFAGLLARRDQDEAGDTVPVAASPGPVRHLPSDAAAWMPSPGRAVPSDRPAPSIHDDPKLGPAPAPGHVAAALAGEGVPVPPLWAALCAYVSSHEPDTDEDHLAWLAGETAGALAYAEAWRAEAETLLHATGLDPAYVQAHHEYADEVSDQAAAMALIVQRFHVIYDALRIWVDEHPDGMPHQARQWLQGSGSPAGDPGDDLAA